MLYRFGFMALAFIMAVPSVSWAVNSKDEMIVDYAGQFVTSLSDWDKDQNRPAQPKVDGMNIATLVETFKTKSGDAQMQLIVNYPQGTGSKDVDQYLADVAKKTMADYKKEAEVLLAKNPLKPGLMSRTFVISRSIDRYLSVLFYDSVEDGVESPLWNYEVMTYDLTDGHIVRAAEAFPESDDGSKASGFLANYVNTVFDNQCLEAGDECHPGALKAQDISQRGTAHMALTPEGVAVIFGPYALGEWVEDTRWINIPKQKMVDWGVRDFFWIER